MQTGKGTIGLAVHGGAGTIERSKMTSEKERAYRAGLQRALDAGYAILKNDGTSLDAVVAAVRVFEDDPLFNAGRGAVFTSAGTNEMDASVMEGKNLMAGAAACLKHVRNPIELARAIMEKSPHVMIAGEGAEAFAQEVGLEMVDEKYFYTEERWQALQRAQKAEAAGQEIALSDQDRHGTVGAVALDQAGNLAAATSTGGNTNKRPGRIGDTPIIGAGTYANNRTCAMSATGDGEYFIRVLAGHEISALIEHRGSSLKDATQSVLDQIGRLGGSGGLIAIDRGGNVALPLNTAGMYRGYINANGGAVIEIYE